jgi:hypothetical protein
MATLYITEFTNEGFDNRGDLLQDAPLIPPVAEQTVAIGAGSVQSAAFNTATSIVQLCADSVCSVEFGLNPTAAATKMRIPANTVLRFAVPPGQNYLLAVITNT